MTLDVVPTKITKYVGLQFVGTGREAASTYLPRSIAMPCCAQVYTFKMIEDLPIETTPCPCGADWSWVVEYATDPAAEIAHTATIVLDVTEQVRRLGG